MKQRGGLAISSHLREGLQGLRRPAVSSVGGFPRLTGGGGPGIPPPMPASCSCSLFFPLSLLSLSSIFSSTFSSLARRSPSHRWVGFLDVPGQVSHAPQPGECGDAAGCWQHPARPVSRGGVTRRRTRSVMQARSPHTRCALSWALRHLRGHGSTH